MNFFSELIEEAEFPEDFKMGPASETIGFHTGGSAGDWINNHLGVPAAEVEIGQAEQMQLNNGWMPKDAETSFDLVQQSWKWISATYRKVGNQIRVKPIGYTKMDVDYTPQEANKYDQRIMLHLEVINHGTSDQIHSDYKFTLENEAWKVVDSNSAYDDKASIFRNAKERSKVNNFYFNGLKKRST
jgi:hypothetical protein